MFFQSKYDRAKKYQVEKRKEMDPLFEEYDGTKLYEETPADMMEKGDMLSLMISGVLTILPLAIIVLLAIVFVSMFILRLI